MKVQELVEHCNNFKGVCTGCQYMKECETFKKEYNTIPFWEDKTQLGIHQR